METPAVPAKNVFLTFDDGPNEPYTSQVLEILRRGQVPASFFVCGRNVERFPETVKKIAAAGHTLGNHTYSHSRLLSFFGFLGAEIEQTGRIITRLTGTHPKHFRPPWGFAAPWLRRYLKRRDYQLVLWDVMAYDWWQPRSKFIARRVISGVRPGAIVLLHDGDRTRIGSSRQQTVAALPLIIASLRRQGYTFMKL